MVMVSFEPLHNKCSSWKSSAPNRPGFSTNRFSFSVALSAHLLRRLSRRRGRLERSQRGFHGLYGCGETGRLRLRYHAIILNFRILDIVHLRSGLVRMHGHTILGPHGGAGTQCARTHALAHLVL